MYDKQIASDIKQCKEIENITQRQGKDNTMECLLDFEYIKNHYRLIRVYLSRLKKLDADPKAIQQIEFVRQFKKLDNNGNATDAGDDHKIFVLRILEKIKET